MKSFLSAWTQRIQQWRHNEVLRNALWLYLVTFGGYLLPLITLPYLSRVLNVANFGLVAYAQSLVWNCITVVEYGFNLTATREVAFHRNNPVQLGRIASAVFAAKALLTVAAFAVYAVVILRLDSTRAHWPLFLIAFLSVLGYCLFPLWLYQGLSLMKMIAIRDFFAKLLSLVSLFLLVRGDNDVFWAAAAPAAGLLFAGLAGFAAIPRLTGVSLRWPSWLDVRAQLVQGWPPFLNMGASAAAHSLSVLLLGSRGLNAEIGWFNAALRLASVPRQLIQPLSTALFAHLSHETRGKETIARAFVERHGRLLTLPFLALAGLLIVLAPWLLPLALGPNFDRAVIPFQILSFGVFIFAVSHLYTTYYMLPCGFERTMTRLALLTQPVVLALLFIYLYFLPGEIVLALNVLTIDSLATLAYARFYYRRKGALA